MAKRPPKAEYEVNGTTYTKLSDVEAERKGHRYEKDGEPVVQQSYAAGVGNYTRGMVDGKVRAEDGKWKDDIKVMAPTPDGLKRVYRWQARQMGSMANGSTAQRTIEIDGETYTAEEIREAFDRAGTVDGQVVRY